MPSVKPRAGWPLRHVNQAAREFVKELAQAFKASELNPLLRGVVLDVLIELLLKALTPVELNEGEDRLTAQLKAAFDAPKTLDALQQDPTENALGYEQHHIVEQNPSNLAKGAFRKFGQELLDDPSNLACVSRFPHEDISALYSSKPFGPGTPTLREILSAFDYDQQRELGLLIMRLCGVLQ